MTEKEFLELFSEKNKYNIRHLELDSYNFCLTYEEECNQYYVNYYQEFEDIDGYTTEIADDDLEVSFELALKIYEECGLKFNQ